MALLSKRKKIEASGIDLMETVTIGGILQVLYFRGEDIKNPIILFIHGGPGQPEIPFLHDFQYSWETHFTIVHWDQRNSGKTFFLNNPEAVLETLNFERALSDAHEVAQYIREKLNQDKIIVLGHSYGSVLGTALVQSYPQYFSAYIGLAQVVNMRDNERVGFDMLLEIARKKGNNKDIRAIESLAPYPPNEAFNKSFMSRLMSVRQFQAKYGIATGGDLRTIFRLLTSPYYSWQEKGYFSKDILANQLPIFKYLFDEFDIHYFGTTFEIPVFIVMGDRDYNTPHTLAKEFFEEISAPHKAFFLIPNAGHFAMMDNKAEFNRVLLEKIKPLID